MKEFKGREFIARLVVLGAVLGLFAPIFADTSAKSEREYQMGVEYFLGTNGKNKDYKAAKNHLQNACYDKNKPIAAACTDVGVMYYEGYGESVDYAKARHMFELACFAPSPSYEACGLLSGIYFLAHGVEKDWHKAKNLALRACEQGTAFGCFFLGVSYLDVVDLLNAKTDRKSVV